MVDEAASDSESRTAAISWHLVGRGRRDGDNLWLREGEQSVRVVWPAEAWASMVLENETLASSEQPNVRMLYRSPRQGRLDLATAWLLGEWAEGQHEAMVL